MDSDLIYNYTSKIEATKRRLGKFQDGIVAVKFLDLLSDFGLSKGRVVYYGARLPKIMQWFEDSKIPLKGATRDDCKECLKRITGDRYAGKTNLAFAEALKRPIHFAKTGEIGEKRDGKDMSLRSLGFGPRPM